MTEDGLCHWTVFTQSPNSNANLFQKHPHQTQKYLLKGGASHGPIKGTQKTKHH